MSHSIRLYIPDAGVDVTREFDTLAEGLQHLLLCALRIPGGDPDDSHIEVTVTQKGGAACDRSSS